MTSKTLCLALLGPTASGKSEFALELAERLNGEIVCLDSTTIYKGFDIGSAKPTKEQQERVPHHLLDILEPNEDFSAGQFVDRALTVIEDIAKRGKIPFVVGGTYFYLRALQHGMYPIPLIPEEVVESVEKQYAVEDSFDTAKMHEDLQKADPKAAATIHPNDKYRVVRALSIIRHTGKKPSEMEPAHKTATQAGQLWLKYSMAISRHALGAQIVTRTDAMIRSGLVEETKKLLEKYPASRALQSVGYAEACLFIGQKITEKQLRNEVIEKTRQLAKRQLTWIRSDPEVRFVDSRDGDRVAKEVENLTFVLKGNG